MTSLLIMMQFQVVLLFIVSPQAFRSQYILPEPSVCSLEHSNFLTATLEAGGNGLTRKTSVKFAPTWG